MPLSQLDPTAALLVIDLQKGIVSMPLAHDTTDIVERSARLARVFRLHHLPVVLVNVTGRAPGRTDIPSPVSAPPPGWDELDPRLGQQTGDIFISKQRVGAFLGTTLHEQLRQRGVTQIFLTGIATASGVESTARSAFDLGYNVVFVTDAMTDRDPEVHQYYVEKVFPRRGETTTTQNVLDQLATMRA